MKSRHSILVQPLFREVPRELTPWQCRKLSCNGAWDHEYMTPMHITTDMISFASYSRRLIRDGNPRDVLVHWT